MNTEQRLERLERENRRFKAGLIVVSASAAVLICLGAAAPASKYAPIETTNLKLVMPDGKVRAELLANPVNGNGLLKFYNWDDDKVLMQLGIDNGPQVQLFGRRGNKGDRNAILSGDALHFNRTEDKSWVQLGFPYLNNQDDSPGMIIHTEHGLVRYQFTP